MTPERSLPWVLPLVAGTASFLSPCVLALVPGYLSFISGTTAGDSPAGALGQRRLVMARSLLFFIGFSIIFVLLGASASAIGGLLSAYRPELNKLFGAFIIVMGLHLAGILRVPAFYRERRIALHMREATPLASVATGMAFAFAWTPCVGPILTTILMYAGSTGTVKTGMAMLALYAVGLGIPFLLAALGLSRGIGASRSLRRFGVVVERASGVLLAGVGVLLFTGKIYLFSIAAQRLFARLGLNLWRFF